MLKRILVALSGTPFTPIAVRWAVELARKHGAVRHRCDRRRHGTPVRRRPIPIGGSAAAHALGEHRVAVTQERIEEEIAGFEEACTDASVSYIVDRERGDPFELLVGLSRYHDLTIIGLRGLFEYGVVHNPDDQVIQLTRHGVRPIIAVSPEHHPVNRVLVSYSGSMESAMAMKCFAQLALWPEATVKIVLLRLRGDRGDAAAGRTRARTSAPTATSRRRRACRAARDGPARVRPGVEGGPGGDGLYLARPHRQAGAGGDLEEVLINARVPLFPVAIAREAPPGPSPRKMDERATGASTPEAKAHGPSLPSAGLLSDLCNCPGHPGVGFGQPAPGRFPPGRPEARLIERHAEDLGLDAATVAAVKKLADESREEEKRPSRRRTRRGRVCAALDQELSDEAVLLEQAASSGGSRARRTSGA